MIEPNVSAGRSGDGIPHVLRVERISVHLRHLYVTRPEEAQEDALSEEVACLYCIAGHGVIGDRWFDFATGRKGHITFFGRNALKQLCMERQVHIEPSHLQRNVLIEGVDVDRLIGRRFTLRGVQFEGVDDCRDGSGTPAPGHGGLRARILNDGWLRPGLADLFVHEEAEPGHFATGI